MDTTELTPSDHRPGRLVRIFTVLALGALAGALIGIPAGLAWQHHFGYSYRSPLTALIPILTLGMKPGAIAGLVIAAAFYRFAGLRRLASAPASRVERVLVAAFGGHGSAAMER